MRLRAVGLTPYGFLFVPASEATIIDANGRDRPSDDFDFAERLEELNEELETLNAEAWELEEHIAGNVTQ